MTSCPQCGHSAEAFLLACPACNALIHGPALEQLASQAKEAETTSASRAIELWRDALQLLPPETKQHETIRARIAAIEAASVDPAKPAGPGAGTWLARLGPLGFFLWKFKTIALIVLTKGKLLLLGLTKLSTLTSMLFTLSIYSQFYGWTFALGIILSIYIHEMGHIWELRKFGIRATAPMFIPGFGALIRSQKAPTLAAEARIGLGGPIWGTTAAIVCWLVFLFTGNSYWSAIARWGAWINLFNLFPIWQLDGGHAFKALTKKQRVIALLSAAAMWTVSEDIMLLVVSAGAVYRIFVTRDEAKEPDPPVLVWFCALIVVLALLCRLPVETALHK